MTCSRALAGALLLLLACPARAQLSTSGALQLFECLSLGDCGSGDRFGSAAAVGDFNDDGFADLAVGVPGETVNGDAGAGSVHVYYGSRAGLRLIGDQIFDQDDPDIAGSAENGDRFGAALAAGDFDDDGIDDLAIGIPGEDIGNVVDAGAVEILFGTDGGGLTTSGSNFFDQGTLPSPESVEANDQFGATLAAGDQHGDGYDWLAIGVPFETQGLFDIDAGVVEVLGSSAGVPLSAMNEVQQNDSCDGNLSEREAFDTFGSALAFRKRGSGGGEWVVGVPGEGFFGEDNVGVVHFDGVEGCWSQDASTVQGTAEVGDRFGAAVATGDFDGDGKQDVAIGVPGESLESSSEDAAGTVNVIFSDGTSSDLLTATGNQLFTQDVFLPDEGAESRDHFGTTLATGDFDGDGIDDLAIGAPTDGESGHGGAGAVGVLYGHASTGLSTGATRQTFDEGFPSGMPGAPPQSSGDFGDALAAGDFDGNGVDDLVIGAPGETAVSDEDGTVTVLYGMDRFIHAFGTVQASSATITVDEPTTSTSHVMVLTRSLSAVVAASIDYAVTGGTATAGADFTLGDGTRTWPVGNTANKAVIYDVLPDTLAEGDETIVVDLSNPSAGTALGNPSRVTITIKDDDVAGTLMFHQSAYEVGEGDGVASIEVDRLGGAASQVSVHFATSNGTATAGSDYDARATTFIFAADETAQFISVPIRQDALREGKETVSLTLSSPGGGGSLSAQSTATLTIVDDEPILVDGFESTFVNWSRKSP